jgi:PGF-pre-PGF domain-containing protein
MKNDFVSILLVLLILVASCGIGAAVNSAGNNNTLVAPGNNSPISDNGTIVNPVPSNNSSNPVATNNSSVTNPGESNDNPGVSDNDSTQTDDVAPVEPVSSSATDNVLAREVARACVIAGKYTTFNFTQNATCVESITFFSDKTLGEISATVEELKNKEASISATPEGQMIYKYFNVYLGTDDVDCISNASINFSVNNSWIDENNINKSSIALNEYNNTSEEWEQLPVNITGCDSQHLHLTANVPSYSSFAITANESDN